MGSPMLEKLNKDKMNAVQLTQYWNITKQQLKTCIKDGMPYWTEKGKMYFKLADCEYFNREGWFNNLPGDQQVQLMKVAKEVKKNLVNKKGV